MVGSAMVCRAFVGRVSRISIKRSAWTDTGVLYAISTCASCACRRKQTQALHPSQTRLQDGLHDREGKHMQTCSSLAKSRMGNEQVVDQTNDTFSSCPVRKGTTRE